MNRWSILTWKKNTGRFLSLNLRFSYVFPGLLQFDEIFDRLPLGDTYNFFRRVSQLLASADLIHFRHAVRHEIVNNALFIQGLNLTQDFFRLNLLLNVMVALREVFTLIDIPLSVQNAQRFEQLAVFFVNNSFINNDLYHWPLFTDTLHSISFLLFNGFKFAMNTATLDILESIKLSLRDFGVPTADQVRHFIENLAAGGIFHFNSIYCQRAVLFEQNPNDLNLRNYPFVHVPPRN